MSSQVASRTTGVDGFVTVLMLGFHVLRVLAHSSAANAGLEPWFDYICGVNSTKIVCSSGSALNRRIPPTRIS